MKPDLIQDKVERVKFLLSHIESLIEDNGGEVRELKERASIFQAATGLDGIETLCELEPSDPQLPAFLLERLAGFFDAGLLLQRGPSVEAANWWVTDLFWRGSAFHLDLNDQVQGNRLVPEVPPLQVQRASALKTLATVNLQFLAPHGDADAYLIKPTPTIAYVLICSLAAPWSVDHVAHAHRLVNKCFIY